MLSLNVTRVPSVLSLTPYAAGIRQESVCCCWRRKKQNRYFPSPEITGREGSTGDFLTTHPVCILATFYETTNVSCCIDYCKKIEFRVLPNILILEKRYTRKKRHFVKPYRKRRIPIGNVCHYSASRVAVCIFIT